MHWVSIGNVYRQSDLARQHYEEALVISRDTGDQWCTASNLGNLGSIYRDKGNLAEALKYDNEALDIAREMGHQLGIAVDLGNIGLILAARSEHEQAVPKLAEALTVLLAIGVADGPGADLRLAGCGKTAASATNFQASGTGRSLHRRHSRPIDQMRMRRPEPTMNLPVCVETAE